LFDEQISGSQKVLSAVGVLRSRINPFAHPKEKHKMISTILDMIVAAILVGTADAPSTTSTVGGAQLPK
jgi:hypothetical protein